MSLSKGQTFHYSSSPAKDDDPVLNIHHLARRSPTCSQAMLASWLAGRQDVEQSLRDFEETFSGARGRRPSTRRRSAQEFEQQVKAHRGSISSDEGLGSSISAGSDKSLSQKFERALDLLDKDSGLGTSVGSASSLGGVRVSGDNRSVVSAKDLVQGWLVRCLIMCTFGSDISFAETKTNPTRQSRRKGAQQASAVTQSIAPPSRTTLSAAPLSSFARKKINKYIIAPILREERFEDFHSLVTSLGTRNKKVRCLRDIERSLIFQPLVSSVLSGVETISDTSPKTFDVTPQLYRSFGEFAVQVVLDTYQHLPESEQRRAADRPYDNGYFLDLVQQVGRLAAQIGHRQQNDAAENDSETTESLYDEVTLEGGLSETGNMAELVMWKNGVGMSARTGEVYQPVPGIKRGASNVHDEDAARSMARRKKGYIPEFVEMKCGDKECDKVFTRKCDLAKHEKTHSRPFKCPHEGCKYHDLGLPTEKERDRHINDKHDPNPQFYNCHYCEFKTKRESNCKQHMEKKHNWEYQRAKGKDKGIKMTPAQTPQTPALDFNSSLQSPAVSNYTSGWDGEMSRSGSAAGMSAQHSAQVTPYEQPLASFDGNYGQTNYSSLFPRNEAYQPSGYDASYNFAAQNYISPVNSHPNMTPVTPAYSNITGQSPFSNHVEMETGMSVGSGFDNAYGNLPTPDSFMHPQSRQASISNLSPEFEDASMNNMYDDNMDFDPMLSANSLGVPDNDFDLFRNMNHENVDAFSNPAAANATLFPTMPNIDFNNVENDLINEIMTDDESNFDFNMSN
jgi:hypothetical protein